MLGTLSTATAAPPTTWPAHIVLRSLCEALHEGLAAHRRYEELRSRGVTHDSALRQALAIAPVPCRPARERITALCFAGRA
jgi:hypothetical protein